MVYTPTNWVEGVTALGPTNMNKIETELAALDGRVTVPTVVNGQWLKGVGGAAVWTALAPADLPAMVGYGTSLPGSPVDGQEYVLVDSTTNPTYQWRFRYNASSTSGYKWECVGGAPATVFIAANEGTASTTYVALATPGPAFTVPRSGEYLVLFSTRCYASAICQPSYCLFTDATQTLDVYAYMPATNQEEMMSSVGGRFTANSGSSLNMRYKTTAGTAQFLTRAMTVSPFRVS